MPIKAGPLLDIFHKGIIERSTKGAAEGGPLHKTGPKSQEKHKIFEGVKLAPELDNLARHFTQAYNSYLNQIQSKQKINIDRDNPQFAIHALARFAGALKKGSSKTHLIDLLHKVADTSVGKQIITRDPESRSKFTFNAFKIPQKKEESPSVTPKPETPKPEISQPEPTKIETPKAVEAPKTEDPTTSTIPEEKGSEGVGTVDEAFEEIPDKIDKIDETDIANDSPAEKKDKNTADTIGAVSFNSGPTDYSDEQKIKNYFTFKPNATPEEFLSFIDYNTNMTEEEAIAYWNNLQEAKRKI